MIKILFFVMLCVSLLWSAPEEDENRVFYPPETPHLDKVYKILEQENYRLVEDSTLADWKGDLFMTDMKDSVRYELILENESRVPVIIGAFYLQPLDKKTVRRELKKFSLGFVVTNLVIFALFFVRF
jgi:hypothetical protein